MKRVLLTSVAMLCAFLSFSQLQEDFDPTPTGWILSQGAGIQNVNGNGAVLTPGVGGNNPAQIGTPAVSKTSNSFEVCFVIHAYTSNLATQINFPCNTYADVLFVKSTVTSANEANAPENIIARVDNYLLPTAGGNTCFSFTFPPEVTDASFKVFLSFHADCNQGGIKYVIDNMNISGVNLVCGGTNCPPGASNDVFNRPMNEMAFNAILYGMPLDISFPQPSGFTTDPNGTDGDQNDDFNHLRWTILAQPLNGTVTVNADGTASITRANNSVTQLTFTYILCDDGPDNDINTTADNMCSAPATVTVNWPANTMPVSLNYFTAVKNRSSVTLKWETASESSNTGFEILKDADNTGFKKIAFVETRAHGGNSDSKLYYEFTDANMSKGTTMYRLRQIDIDGKATLSYIKSVKGDGASYSVTIYPTPSVTGDVSVSVTGIQKFDMYLLDMNGRIVKEYRQPSTDYVKFNNLQSGMYVVKIVDIKTGEQTSEKIMVNRR